MKLDKRIIIIVAGVVLMAIIGIVVYMQVRKGGEVSIAPAGQITLSGIKEVNVSDNAFIADMLRRQIAREDENRQDVVGNAIVREGSITEEQEFDGIETSFLVDIAAAKRTYRIIIHKHDIDSMEVYIKCATKSERRYDNAGCKEFTSW